MHCPHLWCDAAGVPIPGEVLDADRVDEVVHVLPMFAVDRALRGVVVIKDNHVVGVFNC